MYLWILLLIIEGSQVEPVGAEIHTAQADDVLVRDELVRAGLRTALAGDVVVRDGFVVAGIRIALAGDVYSGTNLWEQGYTAQAGDVVAAHCELKATRCSAVYCTTRDVNDIHYAKHSGRSLSHASTAGVLMTSRGRMNVSLFQQRRYTSKMMRQ